MDVFEAIRARRSCRAFKNEAVEPEKIEQILEAARWAPSPANNQPWEFIVITRPAVLEQVAVFSEKARQNGSIELRGFSFVRPVPGGPDDTPEQQKLSKDYSLSFLKHVPVMIAVAGDPAPAIRQELIERVHDGYKYACAAAIQNMLLAAQALGLGSLWFTLYDREMLARLLNIAPEKHLVAVVCIGYPVMIPASPGRLPVKNKVRRIE